MIRPLVPPPLHRKPLLTSIAVIGPIAVVKVGDMIRIDVDDGTSRVTRFLSLTEARQLNVTLALLSR